MKRIFCILLMALLLLVSCDSNSTSVGETTTDAMSSDTLSDMSDETQAPPAPSSEFDENAIVLSFGSLSDIHLTGSNGDQAEQYFRNAIALLKKEAEKHDKNGLDAIGIAGDIADRGTSAQVKQFVRVVNDSGLTNVMLATGNHDYYDSYATLSHYQTAMGESYFQNAVDLSLIRKGACHYFVNGYHFIFIEPSLYGSFCPYDTEVVKWLDNTLKSITEEQPNAYVFLYTHPMIYDTTYGSVEIPDGGFATKYLTTTLSKYPQVVTFSGHLHFSIRDERSIMQTAFTSLGCGSVRYVGVEKGFSGVTLASGTAPDDAYDVSSGLLVQVDSNGNMRITRMYFSDESTFGEPWELEYPKEDESHLKKYSKDRKKENEAPIIEGTAIWEPKESPNSWMQNGTVTISAAVDDYFVHHYKVTVKNVTTGQLSECKYLSDFYRCTTQDEMTKTYTFPVSLISNNEYQYSVEIVAIDSWGAESNKIVCDFTVGGDS